MKLLVPVTGLVLGFLLGRVTIGFALGHLGAHDAVLPTVTVPPVVTYKTPLSADPKPDLYARDVRAAKCVAKHGIPVLAYDKPDVICVDENAVLFVDDRRR